MASPPITAARTPASSPARPFVVPFGVFLGFLVVNGLLGGVWPDGIFLVYPAQTLVCGLLLWVYRRAYAPLCNRHGLTEGALVGFAVLALWVAPQALGWAPPRTDGFNPDRLAGSPSLYALTLALRFARLALVVPWLEEVFWRGYLLRRLQAEVFTAVPFGAFSWGSCLGVAALFAAEHQPADWPAGFLAGLLYNAVAYRTRNLGACVLSHALTNLGLGLYVCAARQWGFW